MPAVLCKRNANKFCNSFGSFLMKFKKILSERIFLTKLIKNLCYTSQECENIRAKCDKNMKFLERYIKFGV